MENQNNETLIRPDRLFEVSWEVCNKVGGIHTVVTTKAQTMVEALGNRYITIGPDIHRENDNTEFEEDTGLLAEWKQMVYSEGIRIRIGRWNVNGRPITILVDFSSFFNKKDDILKALWELQGRFDKRPVDYIEPVLFGYAAGKVIESYCNMFCTPNEMPVAHFHEWMTSSGGLYLRQHAPYTATVFSTHATVVGRSIAGNGIPLYRQLPDLNADDLARQFNIGAKHSLEKIAAANHDCFCTVSDITAANAGTCSAGNRTRSLPTVSKTISSGRAPCSTARAEAQALDFGSRSLLGHTFDREPLIVGTSGVTDSTTKA
ncbi:MAG: glycogen/starch synthase [Alistipes inops]